MANLFFNLPLPALNGAGAAVDVSTMGSPKTIIVDGTFDEASISIEVSVDGGTTYAPLPTATFQGTGVKILPCAAQFMRTQVSGRKATLPFAANVDVGANDAGALFAAIAMPASNGVGAATDVSAFGELMTFIAGGAFSGVGMVIEGSADGSGYAPITSFFGSGGISSLGVTVNFLRVNLSGRKTSVPFSAVLAVGGVNDGGGGIAGIDVEEEGVALVGNPYSTMNFVGDGVTATDVAGVATITVPGGMDVEDEGVALVGNPYSTMNFVGAGVVASDVGGVATITIPGGIAGLGLEDEGVVVPGSFTTMNFIGGGVTATDGGGGVADVTIPSAIVQVGLQAFQYTVTGVEADPTELVITLPAARADAAYIIIPALEQCTLQLGTSVDTASKQVGQFTLSLSGNSTAADVFSFIVIDPT